MTAKFQSLKEELRSLEKESSYPDVPARRQSGTGIFRSGLTSPQWIKVLLLSAFLGMFLLYTGMRYIHIGSADTGETVTAFQNWFNQPDEELLASMGSWMEEMGYTGLSREDLIELRRQGLTATFTSRMRDLGYRHLTLDQLVKLRQNDVSATFATMMKELGYDLSAEDLIELRQHDVTAYYTSNMHDLGYNTITKDELIRLKDVGVSTDDVEELKGESGQLPDINELIRYRISNQ